MPSKKKSNKKKSSNKKTINRYNIFQSELSSYIKETGGNKGDYKKYRGLYKEIGKDVPVKSFKDVINALVLKNKEKPLPTKYFESFPFYDAKAQFMFPIYEGVKIKIRFNDGGVELEWEGTNMDFSIWFTGDVMAYFRNNYSDSGNMANFVLTGGDESTAEYEIETLATAFGTRGYIPSGSAMLSKSVLPKKYTSESAETIGTEERIINKKLELLEKKLQLAAKLEELGYTKEEIRTELNKY